MSIHTISRTKKCVSLLRLEVTAVILICDLDDPVLFSNQPTAIQVVARPFDDEELIEISSVIDKELHRQSVKPFE